MLKYLPTIDVAKILGISRIAVFKKIKKQQLKAQKYGRNYLIDRDDLREYIKQEQEKLRKRLARKQEKMSMTKKQIDKIVKKVMDEYGETLKLLS